MNLIHSFYQWGKKIPALGTLLIACRRIYRHPALEARRLRARDCEMAHSTLTKLYGSDSIAHQYLDAFTASSSFKRAFSVGHSGDFDVMMLYALVRMQKPQVVIETGVASGRSSSAILQALADNGIGKLYSIDLPHFYKGATPGAYTTHEGNTELKGFVPEGKKPGWLVPQELRSRWELILGDSNVELPKLLECCSSVDIFYHDGDHSYETMRAEFTAVWPKIVSSGFVLSDDIDWNDAWKEFTADIMPKYIQAYRHLGVVQK